MARGRLGDSIVQHFLQSIGSGELEPGQQIPTESQLGEQFGVGRSVVREALQALHAKGFLVVRQGSAAAVAPRYRWHILDSDFLAVHQGEEFFDELHDARAVIEPKLAALAARNAAESELLRLEELTVELSLNRGSADHAAIDLAFHETLAYASGNPILAGLHDSLASLGRRSREASAGIPGAIERAAGWHAEIVKAARSRDEDGARAAMELHLRQVKNELKDAPLI